MDGANEDDIIPLKFQHMLPGEHVYQGVLFFGFTPPDTLDAVKDFKVSDDDVFIATYPKAGTTWLQEIVWLIMHDGDFTGAYEKPIYFRSPFLEFKDEVLNEVGLDLVDTLPSPRVIKSHLPVNLMPRQTREKNCKILVLFRNPKDILVSYYHFYRSSSSLGNFQGTWAEFFGMFLKGHVDHGSWFDYTLGWWKYSQTNSRAHILYYEDMKLDLRAEIVKMCNFLDKQLPERVIDNIVEHCQFENMRRNPMTNHVDVYSINSKVSPLLRQGTVGDWRKHFTVAQNEQFDKVYNDAIGHFKIPFKYSIDL